jgi:Protein of unknown function (DUF5672)
MLWRSFKKPSKTVAVVVPGYAREEFTSDEEISLRHIEHFLGPYDKYLVVPKGLNINRPAFRIEGVDPRFFGSATASTKLMLSPSFYKRFADYKYILLCHLDALVLSDRIEEWCNLDLDYIGAPWINCDDSTYVKRERVGNGGFSLRKIESFLRVIYSDQYWVEPDAYWRSVRSQHPGLHSYRFLLMRYLKSLSMFNGARREMASWHLRTDGRKNEDYFWADEAVRYYPPFKVASVEVGLRFAFEVAPRRCFELNHGNLPFGCHAWPRYDRTFWEPYLLK